ncbi:MAG TPA: cytochrome b [Gammaproteobacteria bacterium]
MTSNNSVEKYTGLAQLLHWMIALLVVAQFALAWIADAIPRDERPAALMLTHKSIGITILALVIVRLAWRFLHKPPAFPATMPVIEQWLARIAHWGLYALILAMPLSGWLMVSTAGRNVEWFWLLTVPAPMGENEPWGDFFHDTHEILVWPLFGLAVFHILIALWRTFIQKDGTLQRMLP